MTVTVQNLSVQDANALNQQKIQDFKDGKINITRSELSKSLSSSMQQGAEPSDEVLDIVDAYDKIDKNGDGISYDELQTYKNTPAGILSSLGITPRSISEKMNLLNAGLFNQQTSGQEPSLLDSGIFDDNSQDDGALVPASLWNSSIQSYNKSNPTSDSANSESLIDFLT